MNDNFAIQLFEGKKVRIVWDAEQEKYYFAVADIVQVLTDSTDVKQYIKRMRARDPELNSKWGTICTPVEMLAPDGKRRKGAMVPDPIAPLIKEPQHPEGELGTVGHIPVVGEDVGVFHSSYLREILAATANLEGIFPIHLEIALCLSVFHVI